MVEEKLYGQQEQEDLDESMREAFRQRDERLKKAASLKLQALKKTQRRVKITQKGYNMDEMYQRNSNKAFENAKSKGLDKPEDYMYMYSIKEKDFFKRVMDRKYINFEQQNEITYRLKDGIRFKPLEYITESIEVDMLKKAQANKQKGYNERKTQSI